MTLPISPTRALERVDQLRQEWVSLPRVVHQATYGAMIVLGSMLFLLLWMDSAPDAVVAVVTSWQRADTEGRIRLVSTLAGLPVALWMAKVGITQFRSTPRCTCTADQHRATDGDR